MSIKRLESNNLYIDVENIRVLEEGIYSDIDSVKVLKNDIYEEVYNRSKYEQLVNYMVLYFKGDECTDLTGGYTQTHLYNYSGYSNGCSYSKNSDNIYLHVTAATQSSYVVNLYMCLTTTKTINFNGYERFNVLATQRGNANNYGYHIAAAINPVRYVENGTSISSFGSKQTFTTKTLIPANITSSCRNGYFTIYQSYAGNSNIYAIVASKADNYSELCKLINVTSPSKLNDLITNTNYISAILSNKDAVDFMIKQCTGSFMFAFIANSTCLNLLNSSPYKDIIYNNIHWNKFLTM